jgi:hypothetical protein
MIFALSVESFVVQTGIKQPFRSEHSCRRPLHSSTKPLLQCVLLLFSGWLSCGREIKKLQRGVLSFWPLMNAMEAETSHADLLCISFDETGLLIYPVNRVVVAITARTICDVPG